MQLMYTLDHEVPHQVALEDPEDPTPYWIVSTRRPDDLVAALGGVARPAGTTTADHPVG